MLYFTFLHVVQEPYRTEHTRQACAKERRGVQIPHGKNLTLDRAHRTIHGYIAPKGRHHRMVEVSI